MFEILDTVCTPTKGTEFSGSVDLYAREDTLIPVGAVTHVPLGVIIDLDKLRDTLQSLYGKSVELETWWHTYLKTHFLELKCRSSFPGKYNLLVANDVGEIDIDCPDELCLIIYNPYMPGKKATVIKKEAKIAQIRLMKHDTMMMRIETTVKRSGSIGSTG